MSAVWRLATTAPGTTGMQYDTHALAHVPVLAPTPAHACMPIIDAGLHGPDMHSGDNVKLCAPGPTSACLTLCVNSCPPRAYMHARVHSSYRLHVCSVGYISVLMGLPCKIVANDIGCLTVFNAPV